jgi:hypothetical protein
MINMLKPLTVFYMWDEEARVYVAWSDDVPGLVTEADSFPNLISRVEAVAPELLRDNGILPGVSDVPLAFNAQTHYTSVRIH